MAKKKKTWVVVTSKGERVEVTARHLSSAGGELVLHNRRKTTSNSDLRVVLMIPDGRWASVERKCDAPASF